MDINEQIRVMESFGIPVKKDKYTNYLIQTDWTDIYAKLEENGFEYVEKNYQDDTIGFRTNGIYKVVIIASNPSAISIGYVEDFE